MQTTETQRFANYRFITALATAMAFTFATAGEEPAPITSVRRVAIASFDPQRAYGTPGRGELGDHAADMLTTALVKAGANVVERSHLKKMEQEGEMGVVGILDFNSAPQLGQKAGAEWMIVGSITEFAMKKTGTSIAGVRVGSDEARVKIDARMVDTRTGLILAAATGSGSEKNGSIRLSGGGPFNIPDFLRGANFDSGEWESSQFGKATRKAIHQLTIDFSKQWETAERKCKANTQVVEGRLQPETQSMNFSVLKGLSVMVIIPETILQRRNVPDPAAETEFIKNFLSAGMKVLDDARVEELKEDRELMAMLNGETNKAKLQELRTRFGADILVIGEGIADRNDQQVRELNSVFSRARVEVRAIRMDTGEILAADALHAAGRDMSEVLAGKNALQNASRQIAPKFIGSISQLIEKRGIAVNAGTTQVDIEISGWASLTQATSFLNDIKGFRGVNSAKRSDFRGGILCATVEFKTSEMDDLAAALESMQTMKKYKLTIQTASKAKIEGKVAAR